MGSVDLRHAEKIYNDNTKAVDDVSLSIPEGEFVVFVGPSGCGKSTLLRLIAGLEELSQGEILINGVRANKLAPQARNVAMVFQNYALYPHMTVRKNLAFPLRMSHLPKNEIDRKVARTASLLGLNELLERRPKQLSGGQRQRVAMGRAIVREPAVFLMDEPLSNLDAKLRTQIRGEIALLQRRLNVTTIYVTHDQAEAMTLGDRVVVMHAGKIQQAAPPQEIFENPANTFVAKFIGNPGMNCLPATLRRDGDGAYTVDISGQPLGLKQDILIRYPRLDELIDIPVLVGIRPEAFKLETDQSALYGLTGEVVSVEFLGHETLVYFKLPPPSREPLGLSSEKGDISTYQRPSDENIAARLYKRHSLRVGDPIILGVDTDKLYFFHANGIALDRQ